MAFYIPLLSEAVKGFSGWIERRQVKAEKDAERDHSIKEAEAKAKITRIETGDETERDYDLKVLEMSSKTWIDEIMIVWLLALVTMLFIPPLQPYAIAGFAALESAPMWFQTCFVGAFIAKLGLRFLFSGRTLFGSKVK